MSLASGWARPDSRTSRMRHYYLSGRSLCRMHGAWPGMRLDPKQRPGSDCERCLKTLRQHERDMANAEF